MKFKTSLIVSLLVIIIAAPVVDAIACDDCNDIAPLRDQQRLTNGVGLSDGQSLSTDGGHPSPQGTATAQDLCPVCSDTAAAMGNTCCGAPSMISQVNQLPRMLALLTLSYPINKPPQN